MASLPRASPEDHGVAPDALASFVDALDRTGGVHSYLVLRDGAVIGEGWWEPYEPEQPHSMYSVSKSVTAVAVGMAVAESRLAIDDLVIDLLPEDVPDAVSPRLAAMRVRHLLTMTTGHATDTVELLSGEADASWARAILAHDLDHEPGERFIYNSGATYLLSAILSRLTGESMLDYLRPRLFDPLGIDNPTWTASPTGVTTGGWGLSITSEQLAAFAEFCRQEGRWADRQLVPVDWMRQATGLQVATDGPGRDAEPPDWRQGYGFQFWRSQHGYRADGAFGQFAIVLPEQRMTVVITGGLGDGTPAPELIWQHLLPGVDAPGASVPAVSVPSVSPTSSTRTLRLPTPRGAAHPHGLPGGLTWRPASTGAGARRFALDGSSLELRDFAGTHSIAVGNGTWRAGEIDFRGSRIPVAAAGAWTDESTWIADIWLTATPFRVRMTLTTGEAPTLDIDLNVSFGPTEYARLEGEWSGVAESVGEGSGDGWTLVAEIDGEGGGRLELR